MDLGFLTKLLAGQGGGNSPMSMLLPMLLGAKGGASGQGGNPDLAGMLSGILGQKGDDQRAFPPLFGSETEGELPIRNGLWNMLGNLMPTTQKPKNLPQNSPEYPYELQYNHPYRDEK